MIDRFSVPTVVGATTIPTQREPVYADILRNLPDDQALVLEFPTREARSYGSSTLHAIASSRLAMKISTRSVNQADGRLLLLVWHRQPNDYNYATGKAVNRPLQVGRLNMVVVEEA